MVVETNGSAAAGTTPAAPTAGNAHAAVATVTATASAAAGAVARGASGLASSVGHLFVNLSVSSIMPAKHTYEEVSMQPWTTVQGDVPRPEPESAFPGVKSPDEIFANWLQSRQDSLSSLARAQEDDAARARNAQLPVTERALGAVRAVSDASDKSVKTVTEKATLVARERALQQDQAIYTQHFPSLARTDAQLIGMYECSAIQASHVVSGYLAVTSTHIAFCSVPRGVVKTVLVGGGSQAPDVIVRMEARWSSVALVQPGATLETVSGPNSAPFIVGLPCATVRVNAVNIITTDKHVYGFFHLSEREDMARHALWATSTQQYRDARSLVTAIDRAWRAGTTVPVPGVSYA